MIRDASILVRALRDPGSVSGLEPQGWTALLTIARAESLIGSLAHRLASVELPLRVRAILDGAQLSAQAARRQALWEAEMARRALAPVDVTPILLKGTAYAAAGLSAAEGRSIGDLDILVPHAALPEAEAALLGAGWEWVKADAYDDIYYRRWMHELPPLIHRERDRMIDVHHTILPLTARQRPDSARLIARAVPVGEGLAALSPEEMVVHAATHLLADGDLAGGLRNLWDINCLVRDFAARPSFWPLLTEAARAHGLEAAVSRALRLARRLYGTSVESALAGRDRAGDALFIRRLLARDGWGRERWKGLRFAFYVRSHWLRMPPLMLARHLWTKARR